MVTMKLNLKNLKSIIQTSDNLYDDLYLKYKEYIIESDDGLQILNESNDDIYLYITPEMLKPNFKFDFNIGDIVTFSRFNTIEGLSDISLVVTCLPRIDSRSHFNFTSIYDFDENCTVWQGFGVGYYDDLKAYIPVGFELDQSFCSDADYEFTLWDSEFEYDNLIKKETDNEIILLYSNYVKKNGGASGREFFIDFLLKENYMKDFSGSDKEFINIIKEKING